MSMERYRWVEMLEERSLDRDVGIRREMQCTLDQMELTSSQRHVVSACAYCGSRLRGS